MIEASSRRTYLIRLCSLGLVHRQNDVIVEAQSPSRETKAHATHDDGRSVVSGTFLSPGSAAVTARSSLAKRSCIEQIMDLAGRNQFLRYDCSRGLPDQACTSEHLQHNTVSSSEKVFTPGTMVNEDSERNLPD